MNCQFKKGDRVIGKRYEFANITGTVYMQYNDLVVLVYFDGFPMCVATTFNNLEHIQLN
ncbi:hypothetical protein [Clostridium sp.]|uniref:hypothetical protein n=1 Tax=Clostridium sp. TaxID=1506 RepID=UPI003217324A